MDELTVKGRAKLFYEKHQFVIEFLAVLAISYLVGMLNETLGALASIIGAGRLVFILKPWEWMP